MFTRKDLDSILNTNIFKPEDLITLLGIDYRDLYEADSGVWEGYTLREHTLMAMNQFEKYYSDKKLPDGVDRGFFRFLLALHDIGKPDAIKSGDKHRHHEFTIKIVKPLFKELDFSEKEWQLFKTLINEDYLGAFTRNGDVEIAVTKITAASKETGLSLKDFFSILEIYYKVDASSYTKDSGGKESLDYLFDFDHKNKKLNFSKELEARFSLLKDKLSK